MLICSPVSQAPDARIPHHSIARRHWPLSACRQRRPTSAWEEECQRRVNFSVHFTFSTADKEGGGGKQRTCPCSFHFLQYWCSRECEMNTEMHTSWIPFSCLFANVPLLVCYKVWKRRRNIQLAWIPVMPESCQCKQHDTKYLSTSSYSIVHLNWCLVLNVTVTQRPRCLNWGRRKGAIIPWLVRIYGE